MKRDRPWDTRELAKEAKVSDAYIRKLIAQGKLNAYKIGQSWAIPPEDARMWLEYRESKWNTF
jgi:excisionase family DNA binding protein